MSYPVNHAEVIREALTNITNGQVQGLSWYAVALAQQSHAKSALAAIQKELEEAKASDTESIALYRRCRNRAEAQAERIARLEEALVLYMKASVATTEHALANGWDGIMPDEFEWIKEAPIKARAALAAARLPLDPPPTP